MNLEFFIAKRITYEKKTNNNFSYAIINIAVASIAIGLVIMILSVAILTGFKNQIQKKVTGFGSHILITNFDTNVSYETEPISKNQDFYVNSKKIKGIKNIQVFATKAGIIKTKTDIQGVVLKGIGSDYDWSFFKNNIVDGSVFTVKDNAKTNKVIISKYIADLLKLKVGDNLFMYFIQNPPRLRKFKISGIYHTSLDEFDKLFIIADIAHIQKLNNWQSDQISGFEISIDDFEQINEMTDKVYDIAGYKINSDGSKMRVSNIIQEYPQIFDWLALTNVNVRVILILMLIVAGFNMISGLLIIILERTNMIGVLKALGATNWNIRKIFLYNAAFLITKGLLWGNAIGIVICLLQSYFGIIKLDPSSYHMSVVPINLKLMHLLLLNAGTLFATVLMLLVPSFIVTKISPIKAIRFN